MQKIKRFEAHCNYSEPTNLEIDNTFTSLGFKGSFSYDLVRDIANACSHWMVGESVSNALTNIASQLSEENRDQLEYHENIQRFVGALDFSAFSGNSPLQKAAEAVAFLSSQEGGMPSDEEGTPIPIFQKSEKTSEEKAKEFQEDVKQFVEASQGTAKYLFKNEGNSKFENFAKLTDSQRAVISNLGLLGKRGKIKSKMVSAEKQVFQMEEYSQVARLANIAQMGMPNFAAKFATKQVMVNKTKQAAKQCLVLAIDASSSMNYSFKENWVMALLLDRLNQVEKGHAVLFVTWFEEDICEEMIFKISNKAEVAEFINQYRYQRWGGATNIQQAITTLCEMIKNGKIGEHSLAEVGNPQIVVINDGQDSVDPKFIPAVTTHGFILQQSNENMKSMISNCGGHYEEFR